MYRMTSYGKPFGGPKTSKEAITTVRTMGHIIKGLGYMPINQRPLEQDQRDSIKRIEERAREAKEEEQR